MFTPAVPTDNPTSYDEVPYESHPYAQTHPSRLATVATLFGLSPPPVETARVLELGCAAGGNLIPMAEAFPRAAFVGVDLSARQLAEGQQTVAAAGLQNVTLRHASILDVGDGYGHFDYILCHGVFSWVPREVQEKILGVCATQLTPGGVAYVSYNTYPGWHMRGMIRDMMRYHTARFATPTDRTQQARAFLDFLAESARPDGPYAGMLRTELESLRHHSDPYLYHDHLEEVNDPTYFHQFVSRAAAHGLAYLGESRVRGMLTNSLGPGVEKALKLLAADQIATEQYMDFIRNRTFRETLLVRRSNAPNWQIRPERVTRLHVTSEARPVGGAGVDVASNEAVNYQTPGGVTLGASRPILKAAMAVLAAAAPATVPFGELFEQSLAALGGVPDKQRPEEARGLAAALLNGYLSSDIVELHGTPIRALAAAGERPAVGPVARVRAASGRSTNRRHESVRLNDLERQLVPLLDGTRDRTAIAEALTQSVIAGNLQLHQAENGQPIREPARVRAVVDETLERTLENIAKRGLLVA